MLLLSGFLPGVRGDRLADLQVGLLLLCYRGYADANLVFRHISCTKGNATMTSDPFVKSIPGGRV